MGNVDNDSIGVDPGPFDIAATVRRLFANGHSEDAVEKAIKEALRAFRGGASPRESVDVARRLLDGPAKTADGA